MYLGKKGVIFAENEKKEKEKEEENPPDEGEKVSVVMIDADRNIESVFKTLCITILFICKIVYRL